MPKYLVEESTMTDIANAIRAKTSSEEAIAGSEMAEKISNIRTFANPVLESLTVTPDGTDITRVPSGGVDGYGSVHVPGEPNLVAENIAKDVSIYGVVGSHECPPVLDTSDATATAPDIAKDATAYVNGVKITGTYEAPPEPTLTSVTLMPTGQEFTTAPEENVTGFEEVTILGDDNLVSSNIKSGVSIYGVAGSYVAESSGGGSSGETGGGSGETGGGGTPAQAILQVKSVTPGRSAKNVVPDEGYDGLSRVTVNGDGDLKAANIVKGKNIFGVVGTATATEGLVFDNTIEIALNLAGKAISFALIYERTEAS